MDPKMDSGYLGPGETLEDDYDVLRELLPEETVGIMDQMLCYEVWSQLVSTKKAHTSDTNSRLFRWHGIWATHYPRRYSHHFTLIGCCAQRL